MVLPIQKFVRHRNSYSATALGPIVTSNDSSPNHGLPCSNQDNTAVLAIVVGGVLFPCGRSMHVGRRYEITSGVCRGDRSAAL